MKCFNHPGMDAVGSCKNCFKGVCVQCAKDTGIGVVCSAPCEEEVKSIRAMVERNRKVYPFAARNHFKNAIWLTAMAAVFIVYGLVTHRGLFTIAFGAVLLLGAAFSVFSGRRMTRL
ncbi:MAG: hypothetical protein WBV36_07030 [Terriglobales bacterium]